MDGVSAAAAILQLAQMAGETAIQVHEFCAVIRNAPREITTINNDLHAFTTLVHNLEGSLKSDTVRSIIDEDQEISSAFWTLENPIRNCGTAFNTVKGKIQPYLKADTSAGCSVSKDGSDSTEVQRFSRTYILWYFKRKEVFAFLTELERAKSTFSDAMGSVTLYVVRANLAYIMAVLKTRTDKHSVGYLR